MEEFKILQEEDLDVELTIIKSDGSVLDLNAAQKIYIIITDGYDNIITRFTKTSPNAIWHLFDFSSANIGILKFRILSETTTYAKEGKIYFNLRARYSSSESLDDTFYDVQLKEYLFSIEKSNINTSFSILP